MANKKNLKEAWKPGQSGNPAGRPKRSLDWRQKLAMQVRDKAPGLLAVMLKKAMEGDVVALRFLLERGIPMTRAVAPNVDLPELTEATTLGDKARAILDAVARGDLPPDMGAQLVQAVGATARVVEVDELERRLAALEAHRETGD